MIDITCFQSYSTFSDDDEEFENTDVKKYCNIENITQNLANEIDIYDEFDLAFNDLTHRYDSGTID